MMARFLSTLVLPGGLVVVAAAVFANLDALQDSHAGFVRIVPYAVLAAGLLLGWRLDRSRVVLALLVLALADRGLLQLGAAAEKSTPGGVLAFHAIAFLVPLNLGLFSLAAERGVLTRRGLLPLGVLLGQGWLVVLLWHLGPASLTRWLTHSFVLGRVFAWTPIGQPALLVFALGLAVWLVRFAHRRNPIESGFFWAQFAAFLGLSAGRGGAVATIYFTSAGLILLIALIESTYALAYRDELTRLPARRALNEALAKLGGRYAVAMADIDHFKKFNDQHGHDIGDQLLRMVGAKLEVVSGGGRAFRYGGEEFAILFPGKSVEEVLPHLESLRGAVERAHFTVRGRKRPRKKPETPRPAGGTRKQVSVTISIGVAEPDTRQETPDRVVKAADEALYRAKKAGRNQVKT